MAEQSKIKIVYGFADDTERPIEMGPFASDAAIVNATTAKQRIKAFDPNTIKDLFVSDAGSSCTGITAATITKLKETEINLNVE